MPSQLKTNIRPTISQCFRSKRVVQFASFRISQYGFSSLVLLYCQQAQTVPCWSHYKNTNIAPFLVGLDNTLIELLASPFCARSLSLLSPLFIYFIQDCAQELIHFMGRRGILTFFGVGEFVPSKKHIETFDLAFACLGFSPFPPLLIE